MSNFPPLSVEWFNWWINTSMRTLNPARKNNQVFRPRPKHHTRTNNPSRLQPHLPVVIVIVILWMWNTGWQESQLAMPLNCSVIFWTMTHVGNIDSFNHSLFSAANSTCGWSGEAIASSSKTLAQKTTQTKIQRSALHTDRCVPTRNIPFRTGCLDIHRLIKRFDRMYTPCTLEEMLQFNDKPKNKLEFRLVRSYPPSEDFRRTLIASHAIYQRYQMAIHGDSKSECSLSQFERFLGQSSLQQQSPRLPSEKNPACGYGSFHLQYYLNDQMIACSVIDVLPAGVSSVYFYYEPSLGFLKLGVYSALK